LSFTYITNSYNLLRIGTKTVCMLSAHSVAWNLAATQWSLSNTKNWSSLCMPINHLTLHHDQHQHAQVSTKELSKKKFD
jgi:hypothetical protein